MSESRQADPSTERTRARRARLRRVIRRTLYVKLGLVSAVLLVAGLAYLRLVFGPVSLNDYTKEVGEALAARIGPGWSVGFRDAAIELDGVRPSVRAAGLEIRNPGGVAVVRAPLAIVGVDAVGLLTGTVSLRAIELRDLQIRALVGQDGALSFVTQGEGEPASLQIAPPPPTGPDAASGSSVSQAVASLLEPVLAPNGIVGALDRAVLTNARMTLVGADGRERVGFSRVGARFERVGAGRRQVAVDLEGPHGIWHVAGTAQEESGGRRSVELAISDVPVADLFPFAGLSGLPEGSNLRLSVDLAAALDGRRLTKLDGRFRSNKGVIELPEKNLRFVGIDGVSGAAAWNEDKRTLSLTDLAWASGDTQIRLGADLVQGAKPNLWTMAFAGQDAVLSGAGADDAPVRLARIAGRMRSGDDGLVLEGLSLLGPGLDASLSGSLDVEARSLHATLDAKRTEARALLRLWPPTINPDLRRYIQANLKGGLVDALNLVTVLDGPDLTAAFGAAPVTDGAIKLSVALSGGTIVAADGLPPVTGLKMDGIATGTTALLNGRAGRIELPDGRRLAYSEGFYRHLDMTSAGSIARIGFRLTGGADALASLLSLPKFREASSVQFDPANVRGQVDLRVTLPLQFDRLPKSPAEVPVTVTGTIADLAIDKVYAKERLEGANVALTSDPTGLAVKGEGRISGLPATIDLRQPRGTPGEINVSALLDEAARARRGLPSGSQLSGPVQVKVQAALGPGPSGARAPTRIEADLARATIDGLLPGWQKPAGKPGRLTFGLADGDARDLRDVVVDSGPVQLRGAVGLGEDGGLERADFTSVKLSQGDEMRAQVERTAGVYKVTVRGNVGDARPLIRQITGGAPPAAGKAADRAADRSPDVDLDLALNIVTGHNDEAMTAVSTKASLRRGDLRALQFTGRFRGAIVDAQTTRREGAPPVLAVQAADAGATLRFLDLYKRMLGGRLALNATIGAAQAGQITIDQFALKNEPALRRIFAQGPPATDDRGMGQGARSDADQVYFTKLVAAFEHNQSRTDFKDVLIYGPQVGFTLSGYLDNARDRTDISGTFVPAYGLNNAFSQVPIVGLLLGGGNKNEGLFAVDFRIAGPASAPVLSVNALSAVAPGILRKLFGWAMPDSDVTTGATGAARPSPSRTEP